MNRGKSYAILDAIWQIEDTKETNRILLEGWKPKFGKR